jgi:hypothetical protein
VLAHQIGRPERLDETVEKTRNATGLLVDQDLLFRRQVVLSPSNYNERLQLAQGSVRDSKEVAKLAATVPPLTLGNIGRN